jgi:hypothetical protein
MAPEPIRKQLEKIHGDDFDVVNEETQESFRAMIEATTPTAPFPYDKDIAIHAGNIDRIRGISGLSAEDFDKAYQLGDTYKFTVSDANSRDTYLRVFSPKLGEKIYYNDLTSGGQKLYFNKISGNLDDRPLPKIYEMSEAEQRRFYRIVRTTLRNINDNKPEYTDPASPPRVATFLGKGKAFTEFKLTGIAGEMADEKLKEFATAITGGEFTPKGKNPVQYKADEILAQKLEDSLGPRLGADYSVSEFMEDLKKSPIRQKALNFVQPLMTILGGWINSYASELSQESKTKLSGIFGDSENMEKITRAASQEGELIDEQLFQQFLDPRVHDNLLKALYDPSKPDRKSGFASEFEKHGGGPAIINPMQIAIDRFKYDHLTGTYKKKDVRTFSQKIKKGWEDWTEEHVIKLWKRNLRHNYVEPLAKPVVDALCKAEVSPTKGLAGILEKRADIEKKLEGGASPGALDGFKFLCDTLQKIAGADDMKNAFNGGLKNGKQCEAIAKEIIKAALANVPVTNTVLEKAKVALETLAVMRYDTFSSARGAEIQKSLLSADFLKGTKVMESPGAKIVFGAAQKLFNYGLTGAFWMTTAIRNTIQQARGKMDESEIAELVGAMDKIQENADENMTVESAAADLETAKRALAEFEQKLGYSPGGFKTKLDQQEKIKTESREQLDEDAQFDEYRDQQKIVDDFNKGKIQYDALPDKVVQYANHYVQQKVGAIAMNNLPNEDVIKRYGPILVEILKYALSPAQHTSVKGQFNVADKWLTDDAGPHLKEYYRLQAGVNIATDGYDYQMLKRKQRLERKTEHNDAFDPHNEVQAARTLMHFWNACNGYDFGLNINDYNFFKKYEHQSQKTQFNVMLNARLGKFDPNSYSNAA